MKKTLGFVSKSGIAFIFRKVQVMSDTVSIKGLDKAEVLAALFNASKQQGMGFLDPTGSRPMSVEDARQYTDRGGVRYYDYLRGRVMKVDLSKDEMRTGLYDRDNGQGAALRALQPLLSKQKVA
jgi:hypothetical protein